MTASQLTEVVLARYAATPNPRHRNVLQSLISHAHAFVREIGLTEQEWLLGMEFLTATGQISDEKRQEMILLSDNLGISALVNLISAGVPDGCTESTVVGPFYVAGAARRSWGESLLARDSDETPLIIHGHVLNGEGQSIAQADLDVWQTDSNGMYDIQDVNQPQGNLRGRYTAAQDGEYMIRTIRPTSYPIPTDGPVGALLRATARGPFRPAHIHVIVRATGYNALTTHLFDAEDQYLDCDVVFAVKESLIRRFTKNESAEDARRFGLTSAFWELKNNFVLSKAV
jgi:protocatechuate 3,4-dioxygenase beta subunit